MITIEQCRGARGILAWTQQDLADASGLSKTAINNFEKGHSDIKAESLRAIRMAFESADIEFIGQHGVSKRSETIKILRGPTALGRLIEDMHNTMISTDTEILIRFPDAPLAERISSQTLFKHIDFLKTTGTKQRIVDSKNTSNAMSPSDENRWIETNMENLNISTFIYGGKVAIELWDRAMIVVINSPDAYKAEKQRFEKLWSKAKPVDNEEDIRQRA